MALPNQCKSKEAANAKTGCEADGKSALAIGGGGSGDAPTKSQINPHLSKSKSMQASIPPQGSVSHVDRQHKRSLKTQAVAEAKGDNNNENNNGNNNDNKEEDLRAWKQPPRGRGCARPKARV